MFAINVTKITKIVVNKNEGETFSSDIPGYTEKQLEAGFILFLSFLITKKVQEAVRSQQVNGVPMGSMYKPLSKGYNARKDKANKDKFWKNTEFLINNLKVGRTMRLFMLVILTILSTLATVL
jgi:hypothetical protein